MYRRRRRKLDPGEILAFGPDIEQRVFGEQKLVGNVDLKGGWFFVAFHVQHAGLDGLSVWIDERKLDFKTAGVVDVDRFAVPGFAIDDDHALGHIDVVGEFDADRFRGGGCLDWRLRDFLRCIH